MLRTVQILGFRAIRYAEIGLRDFQVLVGPNASGKSTFLDATLLVRDVLTAGLEKAFRGDARFDIPQRVADPRDATWMRQGGPLEVALTFDLPSDLRAVHSGEYTSARYEIGIDTSGELAFTAETLWLCRPEGPSAATAAQESLFPAPPPPPPHIITLPNQSSPQRNWRKVISKNPSTGNDTFKAERGEWKSPFRLGAQRSGLANLPADEERFPVALWVRRILMEAVMRIQLNAEHMRRSSPAGSPRTFSPDGANLPWVVHELETTDPERFQRWIEHVRTALPDVESISTREREEDRSRYLEVKYRNGLLAPAWVLSDGTLRLLALTLLAYTDTSPRIVLIEEPENGIHPRGIEAVIQSLQSVYDGQVFVATHSALVLSQVRDEDLLCFAKNNEGAIAIVPGAQHPRLSQWRSGLSLGDLFAAGVLG